MTPFVSVIIATYKREIELESALASLRTQIFDNFEIVLVDDNGNAEWNEKVKTIADGFVENNPNIPFQYIVNSPNQGSAKTRNIGIDAAKGILPCILITSVVCLPILLWKIEASWMTLVIKAAIFCAIYAGLLYKFGLNQNEKSMITSRISKLSKR